MDSITTISLPKQPTSKAALLCLHGAFCSAHDYQFFLPFLALRGFPAYALSIRAHGNSWVPSMLRLHFWTTVDDYVLNIKAALQDIRSNHLTAANPPVIAGHSGRQIMANWEQVETEGKDRRKILCVAAEHNHLANPEMVTKNAEAYRAVVARAVDSPDAIVMETTIQNIAHNTMMDIGWQECAIKLVNWIQGRQLDG